MSILLVNDHLSGGIGRYVRGLYSELRTLYAARHSVHLLLQNVPRHADATAWSDGNANDITMQRRPWWEKQSGYGTLYQLASRYYYPQRIPRGYALYHVTSQMMGQSVRHVGPAVVTVHDLVALRYPGNHPWLSTQIRKRHIAALQLPGSAHIRHSVGDGRSVPAREPFERSRGARRVPGPAAAAPCGERGAAEE